jgi:hypothetical protein
MHWLREILIVGFEFGETHTADLARLKSDLLHSCPDGKPKKLPDFGIIGSRDKLAEPTCVNRKWRLIDTGEAAVSIVRKLTKRRRKSGYDSKVGTDRAIQTNLKAR